jgi:hypothetical protein
VTDITAEQLAAILRQVATWNETDHMSIGSLELWTDPHGEWVGNFAGTDAADIAAMCLVRRLKADGWVPQFWPNTVRFWNGGDYPEETYEHHPVEALAKFAASRKGTA